MSRIPVRKAFSLFEMIVVIIILGIMFRFSKGLLNTAGQDRKIYGETCINYVFGRLANFNSDIIYGRYTGLLLSGNLVPDYFLITSTGYLNSARTQGWGGITVYGRNGATGSSYFPLQFMSPTASIPLPCQSARFALVAASSVATGTQIYIPAVSHTDSNRYIGRDWTQQATYPSVSSGEILLSSCDKGAITVGNPSYMSVKNCVDVGKIAIDKRSQHIYLWKCARINPVTGLCTSRPAF